MARSATEEEAEVSRPCWKSSMRDSHSCAERGFDGGLSPDMVAADGGEALRKLQEVKLCAWRLEREKG